MAVMVSMGQVGHGALVALPLHWAYHALHTHTAFPLALALQPAVGPKGFGVRAPPGIMFPIQSWERTVGHQRPSLG